MCKGANAIMVNAESSVGTGLVDEATCTQTKGISFALDQALWGPVAVRGTSGVEAGTAKSAELAVGIEWIGLALLYSLGHRESPDSFSNKGGASIGVGGKGVLGLLDSFSLAKSTSVAG